jgi:catechol 2,3-dioxygenase-like lactoylglutathione lyase family enzyme
MLSNKEAAATIPVKNIERAKQFYERTLGLTKVDDSEGDAIVYETGKSRLLVYESQYAGTNKATAATWGVGDDLEGEVQALKSKGVAFEHYDMPNTTLKGDVHVMGDTKAAWFKDPDGNIIALVNR